MRLMIRVWFWLLALPLLLVGSFVLSFGLFAILDMTLGGTVLNIWGDMEGLIIPVWVGAGLLSMAGLALLIGYLMRAQRDAGSA